MSSAEQINQKQASLDAVTREAIYSLLYDASLEFMKPDDENKHWSEMFRLITQNRGSILKCYKRDRPDQWSMLSFVCEFARKVKLRDWAKRNTMPIVTIKNPDSRFDGCRLTIAHGDFTDVVVIAGMAPEIKNQACCAVM
jgi:hypothetical protein